MNQCQISQDTFHSFSTGCFLLFLLLHPRSSQAPHFRPLSLSHPLAYMACVPSLTASRRRSCAGLNPHNPKHNNKPFLPAPRLSGSVHVAAKLSGDDGAHSTCLAPFDLECVSGKMRVTRNAKGVPAYYRCFVSVLIFTFVFN